MIDYKNVPSNPQNEATPQQIQEISGNFSFSSAGWDNVVGDGDVGERPSGQLSPHPGDDWTYSCRKCYSRYWGLRIMSGPLTVGITFRKHALTRCPPSHNTILQNKSFWHHMVA